MPTIKLDDLVNGVLVELNGRTYRVEETYSEFRDWRVTGPHTIFELILEEQC